MSLNKVILIGRLGQDVELKTTNSGTPVANFSLATSTKYNGVEKTTWHKIIIWNKLAELCNSYLAKGRQCYLEGSIEYREWTDKEGNKKISPEITAQVVKFIGSGQEASAPVEETSFANDNIPF